ncbi:MAG: DUF3427 domain-containing protein [Akkermansiaceae bacterium]
MSEKLSQGIYEDLLTNSLKNKIKELAVGSLQYDIKPAELSLTPDYLTRTLSEHILKAFSIIKDNKSSHKQRDLANKIIDLIAAEDEKLEFLSEEKFSADNDNLLTEISNNSTPLERPSTPLITPSLFTGSAGSPQLGKELELEFASADRVDMLVSFIKSAGTNLIFPALKDFTDRGGKLRIITTTYLGASDPSAIEKLKSLSNTEVKISYDTKHSRLHAKAYFIHRNSGHSCAYIGSANLSHAAMTSGLEWTVKLPLKELPSLFRRCAAQFETYWESDAFKSYTEKDKEFLIQATKVERGSFSDTTKLTVFEFRPYEHQKIVLDELQEARVERAQFRNLVVAATGTGKTMIAAFDYKQQCLRGRRPKLLFLAHRKELLNQSRDSFRHVLADGSFGEELHSGKSPDSYDYLFASVKSFNNRKLIEELGVDFWDIVILDEAHHGKASSYREILTNLKPKILLGLTATPERTDGTSIAEDFDSPIAAEIRLPDALQQKLLCPFHYYAIADHTVDFSRISWKQGRYDSKELSNILTGNTARINLIINKIVEYFPAPLNAEDFDRDNLKALGFCVSQRHASEMATQFTKAGINSISLDANSSDEIRDNARQRLRTGEINFIFTVDLFNEGVDIPEVNAILFLRPTESHVVFLQQLGRGLRNHKEKDQLIVLDFVGAVHNKFRFDLRLKSLLPGKRNDLRKEIEHGFPHLPAGSYIHFEKAAKEYILKNLRQTYSNIETRVLDQFSNYTDPPTFSKFIKDTDECTIELLSKRTWSDWKDLADFETIQNIDIPTPELKSLPRVSLTNDPLFIEFLITILDASDKELSLLLETNKYTAPAYYLIWNKPGKDLNFTTYKEAFTAIRKNLRYLGDLKEVLAYAKSQQLPNLPNKINSHSTLRIHATYSMREITAAFGKATIDTSGPAGTGVVSIKDEKTYIHFITFDKDEKLFAEANRYRDFLSSRNTLHWESQSSVTQNSQTGRNYLQQNSNGYKVHFFARMRKAEGKLTSPYLYLGEAEFVNATGNRPIAITWQLHSPTTHEFFNEAKIASGIS